MPLTPMTRPPRPSIPSYSKEELALVRDAYAAGEDVYTRETFSYPDGRTGTREIDPRNALRIPHDSTDAPTCPVYRLTWGHIDISSAKSQRDELTAIVGALESLSTDDWLMVKSASCKRGEYVVRFPSGTELEVAKDITRAFARGVFDIGGGHNGVIAEIDGDGDNYWTIGAEWLGDSEEP